MDTLIEKFLGRNYHLAMLIVVLSFLLCLWGHMSGGEWTAVATSIFGAFRAGDAVVNWIHSRPSKNDATDDSTNSEPSRCVGTFPLTGKADLNDKPS